MVHQPDQPCLLLLQVLPSVSQVSDQYGHSGHLARKMAQQGHSPQYFTLDGPRYLHENLEDSCHLLQE